MSEGFSSFGFNVAFVTRFSLHFNIAADVSEMVLTHSFAAAAYVNDSCPITLINWECSPEAIRTMRRQNTHEERMHEMGALAGGLFPPGTGEQTETDGRRKDIDSGFISTKTRQSNSRARSPPIYAVSLGRDGRQIEWASTVENRVHLVYGFHLS